MGNRGDSRDIRTGSDCFDDCLTLAARQRVGLAHNTQNDNRLGTGMAIKVGQCSKTLEIYPAVFVKWVNAMGIINFRRGRYPLPSRGECQAVDQDPFLGMY